MSAQRGRRRRTLGVGVAAAALLLSVVAAGPALAAAPENDDISTPRVVGALPYADGPYDTTEATTGPTDPGFCYEPEVGADLATVWYAFTPDDSGAYLVDTFGSDYDTTLYVGTASGGGIDVIDCNDDTGDLQSAVILEATAGTTYLIMVGTCCGGGTPGATGGGGNLVLHVDVAPPMPTISLTVDPRGSFDPYGGATIRGTVSCTGEPAYGWIDVSIAQKVGRFTIRGYGGIELAGCGEDPVPWEVRASSEDGKLLGGKATVEAFAYACGAIFCADAYETQNVQLRRR